MRQSTIMNTSIRPAPLPLVAVTATWVIVVACIVVMLVLDLRLSSAGRSDLQQVLLGIYFLIPIASAALVGSALVLRQPRHPVGWLFLILSVFITGTGVIDGYVAYGAVARPGSLPGAQMVAVFGGSMFIVWLSLPALILLLTPGGRIANRFTRCCVWTTAIGAIVGISAGMVRPYTGDYESLGTIRNPLELSFGADVFYGLRWGGIIAVHLGVLAGVGAIVGRFHAAKSAERLQLRWVWMASIPFALFAFGALAAALLDAREALSVLAACFVGVIPLAVGLASGQHHLYDIDRLVSRAVTWLLLTAALIGAYVVVVIFVGQSIGRASDSAIPVAIATLAAASIAGPLRRMIQDALDRRFNRRRFETLAMLRAFSREPAPSMTVEQALRTATGDPSLAVAYWIGEREVWVNEGGLPIEPSADGVTAQRRAEAVCVVDFDRSALDRQTVEAATAEVLTELENARLRAAITLQLVEVRDSRARIVEAQLAERHRIERDLQDGAQQRLLGLAMQLRAAELSGDADRMQSTVATAVDELQAAVRELRELANGLRPAILTDGGLTAALEDLATRSPVPVHLEVTEERFAQSVEETAWFIACEAVANAAKHATPRSVVISTCRTDGRLRLVIEDDGAGGANPTGNGLRGIADRAEAAGGWLSVRPRGGGGTVVIAELPCES